MAPDLPTLSEHALAIWTAGVDAVRPEPLIISSFSTIPTAARDAIAAAPRVLVVGCGKAGASMAVGLEAALADHLDRVTGLVNVPEGSSRQLKKIRLHPARPAGSNHPTAAGVAGAEEMLRLLGSSGPEDVAICLLSGGGSALLPCPIKGVTLADKQAVTKLLHSSGATIGEMNAVRKHLSRVKGGRLAEAFRGKLLVSLIISDVVGDPLDVIASGPTTPDPTTFADALAVLERHRLVESAPPAVVRVLREGQSGLIPETPKSLPPTISNMVIGNNAMALEAAAHRARDFGYRVLSLGPFVEGESRELAVAVAGVVRSVRTRGEPLQPPLCILIGGETTVSLSDRPGKGGRNQEFVLAALTKLGTDGMAGVCVLSGGTDGEDGPTDAAGAVATSDTLARAVALNLDPRVFLDRHDSYHFFDATGGLIRTGLTETNVMDVRVILII
jgi:glycerate 2-kinase